MSAISAIYAGKEKALHLTICNQYVGGKAWCSLVAVYDHFSAVSMMRHAACNGAVFFGGAGMAPTYVDTNDTPRRPSMVLLVGERSRSLANLLAGLPIPASNATSTAVKKHLHTYNGLNYVYAAPHKTGAGRGKPKLSKATPDAESVFFCVCYMCHSMAWCVIRQRSYNRRYVALLAYHAGHNGAVYCLPSGVSLPLLVRVTVISRVNSTSRRLRMVMLAGQSQDWPVSSNAGISTPVNVTAPIERGNSSDDSLIQSKEAAAMVATPTQTRPEFIFYFLAVRRADLHDIPHRESVTVPDKLTARRSLVRRYVLSFAGRIPVKGGASCLKSSSPAQTTPQDALHASRCASRTKPLREPRKPLRGWLMCAHRAAKQSPLLAMQKLQRCTMHNRTFRINGRAVNKRGLTVGINYDVTATSDRNVVAEANRMATTNGLKHIRIVCVREGVSHE